MKGYAALAWSIALHAAGAATLWLVLAPSAPDKSAGAPVEIGVDPVLAARSAAKPVAAPVRPPTPPDAHLPRASELAVREAPPAAAAAEPQPADVAATQGQLTAAVDGTERVFSIGQYVQWVRAHNRGPEYPRVSRARGEQGRVVVRAIVAASGRLEGLTLELGSGFEALDRAALDAVQAWNFPAFRGPGRPVSIEVPFRFSLNGR